MSIVMRVNGQVFDVWTRCELIRSLRDIAGSFLFDYNDRERLAALLPAFNAPGLLQAVTPGPPVRVEIDGELVLAGYVVDVNVETEPARLTASLFGVDRSGDLVECSANPTGPAEYVGLDLLGIVRRLIAPFGMTVTAQTDVGDQFPHFAIDASETVMSAIEKAARQRGILVVSDGVGGLLLTSAGATRAASPILAVAPGQDGNIHRSRLHLSWRARFSDHYIKGQLPHVRTTGSKAPAALGAGMAPAAAGPPLPPKPAATTGTPRKHAAGRGMHGPVYQTGHATDAGVTRYRPRVWLTRAEAGLDTVDEQADWRARLTAAQSASIEYTVVGHRPKAPDGSRLPLWSVNTLTAVTDPVRGLAGVDQLIDQVRFLAGEDGDRTVLRVVDPATYVLDEELVGTKRAGRTAARRQHATDATARRFQ